MLRNTVICRYRGISVTVYNREEFLDTAHHQFGGAWRAPAYDCVLAAGANRSAAFDAEI